MHIHSVFLKEPVFHLCYWYCLVYYITLPGITFMDAINLRSGHTKSHVSGTSLAVRNTNLGAKLSSRHVALDSTSGGQEACRGDKMFQGPHTPSCFSPRCATCPCSGIGIVELTRDNDQNSLWSCIGKEGKLNHFPRHVRICETLWLWPWPATFVCYTSLLHASSFYCTW